RAGNTASVDQLGNEGKSTIEQIGENATVGSSDNDAGVIQAAGSVNAQSLVIQGGRGNDADVRQGGTDNSSPIRQNLLADGSSQENVESDVDPSFGSNNYAFVDQIGTNNASIVNQGSPDPAAGDAGPVSENNFASVTQTGIDGLSTISQSGDLHSATLLQG